MLLTRHHTLLRDHPYTQNLRISSIIYSINLLRCVALTYKCAYIHWPYLTGTYWRHWRPLGLIGGMLWIPIAEKTVTQLTKVEIAGKKTGLLLSHVTASTEMVNYNGDSVLA